MKRICSLVFIIALVFLLVPEAQAGCGKCHGKSSCHKKLKSADNLLSQLPEAKEMAYHKMMREMRSSKAATWKKMQQIKGELAEVFTAEKFDEKRFKKLKSRLTDLKIEKMRARNTAVAKLAKTFNAKERKVLWGLLKQKKSHRKGASSCPKC